MNSSLDIEQAARDIAPYLPELLPLPEAQALQARLQTLLSLESAHDRRAALQETLSAPEIVQTWVNLYQTGTHPVDTLISRIRTYHPLAGRSEAIASPRYRCPVASCHRTWYRRHVEEIIPDCPIHGIPMVRDSKVLLS